jgi:spore coat protein U-like protein
MNAVAVITLGQGFYSATGSSLEEPLRRLQNGASANYLNYNLYQNSGKTTIWGNSTSTGVTVTGTGTEESTSVYGEIPAGQSVPAGSYTDNVIATVTY